MAASPREFSEATDTADGKSRPFRQMPRPGEAAPQEEAWLPGLAEAVPDARRFPKLTAAVRQIRARNAWLSDQPSAATRAGESVAGRSLRAGTTQQASGATGTVRLCLWSLAVFGCGAGSGLLLADLIGPRPEVQLAPLATAGLAAAGRPADAKTMPGAAQAAARHEAAPARTTARLLSGNSGFGAAAGDVAIPVRQDLPPAIVAKAELPMPAAGPPAPVPAAPGRGPEILAQAPPPPVPQAADGVDAPTGPAAPEDQPVPPAELERAFGRTLYELGQLQQADGAFDAALESYQRAAVFDPEHAQTFYDCGYILQQRGDMAGAIEKYREAVLRDPGHRFARYNIGYLMQMAGNLEGARATYEAAIEASAAIPFTHYNLGYLLQKAGEQEAAMAQYRAALEEQPDMALANYNLGRLLQTGGDDRSAIEHYRRAIAAEPDLPDVRANLRAVLTQRLGHLKDGG